VILDSQQDASPSGTRQRPDVVGVQHVSEMKPSRRRGCETCQWPRREARHERGNISIHAQNRNPPSDS
jgi:hypothetical protein